MKFAIIDTMKSTPYYRDTLCLNIGDTFQAYVLRQLLLEMGIPSEDIISIDPSELWSYDGEYAILLVNFFFGTLASFYFSPKLIPVFLGLHHEPAGNLYPRAKQTLTQHQPIGCRDERTMLDLRKEGIQSYLAGCITATLPKMWTGKGTKIFCVNAPLDIIDSYIPKELTDKYEVIEISHLYIDDETIFDRRYEEIDSLIRMYTEEACLVVTNKLHVASPCIALGVPTIIATNNRSSRMSWIDKFVPIYTDDEFDKIDWHPLPVEFEATKKMMKDVAKKRISEAIDKYQSMYEISGYFENREHGEYDSLVSNITKNKLRPDNDSFEYVLWGAFEIGVRAVESITKSYPKSKLVCVVDSNAIGYAFFGHEVKHPSERHKYPNALIIVAGFGKGNIKLSENYRKASENKFDTKLAAECELIEEGKICGKDYVVYLGGA